MNLGVSKTTRALVLVLLALVVVTFALRAGEMEPWAPPGPTMKPLGALEPRREIWAELLPLVIEDEGSAWYLGESISFAGAEDGITIAADDVTIDLNGFTLSGPGSGAGSGIRVDGTRKGTTILNGRIHSWGGSGVEAEDASETSVKGVSARYNGSHGLNAGYQALVTESIAYGNGGDGIRVQLRSKVSGCEASVNAQAGIHALRNGNIISDSVASWNENGIFAEHMTLVTGCNATQNHRNGIRVGTSCRVVGNACNNNGWNDPVKCGILVTHSGNHVEGNTLAYNNIGIQVDDVDNVIVRNVSINDYVTRVIVPGNDEGPWGSAATATSPWANIER
jgi:hypothetical protein